MLSFDEALSRLLENSKPLMPERIPVAEACHRVLASDVHAVEDLPRADYSAMDGYALAGSDLPGDGPWTLPVAGESRTGRMPQPLAQGSVCRIFTGGLIPDGADAVVMQEDVERREQLAVFSKKPRAGAHIRRRGEDIRAGQVALQAGTRLRPAHLALAASCDSANVWVARRPVVAIVSTGDELRYPGEPSRPATLPESVSVAIGAMARLAGAEVRIAPFAADDLQRTRQLLEQAMIGADLLVTVGGVSVGDYDVVRDALESVGVVLDFWKVRIKPGKPLAVGTTPAGRFMGLPGNPTSAQVTFALFGVPLLRALQGDSRPVAPRLRARLAEPIVRSAGRLEFQRGTLSLEGTRLVARSLSNQASGATTTIAAADCLLVIPPELSRIEADAEVDVIRLDDV